MKRLSNPSQRIKQNKLKTVQQNKLEMKIGDKFKYRHGGKHDDVTLIILHDHKENRRYLYNIDYKVRIGDVALLYSEYIGRATKDEIKKYTNKN